MESAAGREVANNGGHFGPIKVDGSPALRRRRAMPCVPEYRRRHCPATRCAEAVDMVPDPNRGQRKTNGSRTWFRATGRYDPSLLGSFATRTAFAMPVAVNSSRLSRGFSATVTMNFRSGPFRRAMAYDETFNLCQSQVDHCDLRALGAADGARTIQSRTHRPSQIYRCRPVDCDGGRPSRRGTRR